MSPSNSVFQTSFFRIEKYSKFYLKKKHLCSKIKHDPVDHRAFRQALPSMPKNKQLSALTFDYEALHNLQDLK